MKSVAKTMRITETAACVMTSMNRRRRGDLVEAAPAPSSGVAKASS
jgi:hypothetical protein